RGPGPGNARRRPRSPRRLAARRARVAQALPRRGGPARTGIRPARRRQGNGGARPGPPPRAAPRALGLAHHAGAGGGGSAPASARARRRAVVTWRPTTLNLSLATLLGWALLLGVLGGRAELIVAAVPLVVALAAGRRPRPAAADWQVARHVSRDRL